MSVAGAKGKKQKRKKRPTEDKAQSERFIALAWERGVDESGKDFERALQILKKGRQA